MSFSIKYCFFIFLFMTFIEFVTLQSNLLLCWHYVGGGSHVSVVVLSTYRFVIQLNHSPPNIIHEQLLIWTLWNQFRDWTCWRVACSTGGSIDCPIARHIILCLRSTGPTHDDRKMYRNDWTIVDWDVKHLHKQNQRWSRLGTYCEVPSKLFYMFTQMVHFSFSQFLMTNL